jgi:AraC family transcriptional regulator
VTGNESRLPEILKEDRVGLREKTLQDYQERLNRVLHYIEKNIEQSLSLDEVAEEAGFSQYHFHRLFSAYLGESLHGYVRRLRLERAGKMLKDTPLSVTEIALRSGYENPASFTKAFKQRFGINPKAFRKEGRAYGVAKKVFQAARDASPHPFIETMPQIRTIPDIPVLFVRRRGSYDRAASAAWKALMSYAHRKRLIGPDTRAIGISFDDPEITVHEKIRYDACLTAGAGARPDGEVGLKTIAGGTYAVFHYDGPIDRIDSLYTWIFRDWLPDSGQFLRDQSSFDVYSQENLKRRGKKLDVEVFVPVR